METVDVTTVEIEETGLDEEDTNWEILMENLTLGEASTIEDYSGQSLDKIGEGSTARLIASVLYVIRKRKALAGDGPKGATPKISWSEVEDTPFTAASEEIDEYCRDLTAQKAKKE